MSALGEPLRDLLIDAVIGYNVGCFIGWALRKLQALGTPTLGIGTSTRVSRLYFPHEEARRLR